VWREGGDGLRETCRSRVYFWRGADEPSAGKAALVAYEYK